MTMLTQEQADELHRLAQPLTDHPVAGKLACRVCDLLLPGASVPASRAAPGERGPIYTTTACPTCGTEVDGIRVLTEAKIGRGEPPFTATAPPPLTPEDSARITAEGKECRRQLRENLALAAPGEREERGAGEVNVNGYVCVKLTPRGEQLHRAHWAKVGISPPPTLRTTDDGWSEFQLWDLMHVFGERIYNGCEIPFETTIRLGPAARSEVTPPPPCCDKGAAGLVCEHLGAELVAGIERLRDEGEPPSVAMGFAIERLDRAPTTTTAPDRRKPFPALDEMDDAPDGAALELDGGRGWYARSGKRWIPVSEAEGRRLQAESLGAAPPTTPAPCAIAEHKAVLARGERHCTACGGRLVITLPDPPTTPAGEGPRCVSCGWRGDPASTMGRAVCNGCGRIFKAAPAGTTTNSSNEEG